MCIWNPQIDTLVSSGFIVLRYEQYGKGLSGRPAVQYNRDQFKRQHSELLDSLKLTQPVDILGPGFGGTIAINYAATNPQRINSIILISPVLDLLKSDSPLAGPHKLLRIPDFAVMPMVTISN